MRTLCVLILCLSPFSGSNASAADVSSLRPLVKDSDCVIRGEAVESRATRGGLIHVVRVRATLWGDEPGTFVLIFTPAADVPDSPRLERGMDSVLGVCWIDSAREPWAERLRARDGRDAAPAGGRVGLVAEQGVLAVKGRDSFVKDLAEWIAAIRKPEREGSFHEAVLKLLGHSDAALRRSAIDELAESKLPLDPELVSRVQSCLANESSRETGGACLRSWINLVELRSVPDVGPALRALVLSSEDEAIAVHAAQALALTASPSDREAFMSESVAGEGRRSVRALFALGKMKAAEAQPTSTGEGSSGGRNLAEVFLRRIKKQGPDARKE